MSLALARLTILLVGFYGAVSVLETGRIYGKAFLAQQLLERAWQDSNEQNKPVKAWPWADSWPIAKLQVPKHNIEQIVLAGDQGANLAFGPGLSAASQLPGKGGLTVISAHNDTHFRFLKDIKEGDELNLSTLDGTFYYRVTEIYIAHKNDVFIDLQEGDERLILTTCYPFDIFGAGSDNRYMVAYEKVSAY